MFPVAGDTVRGARVAQPDRSAAYPFAAPLFLEQ
jgi:hypothetical protein